MPARRVCCRAPLPSLLSIYASAFDPLLYHRRDLGYPESLSCRSPCVCAYMRRRERGFMDTSPGCRCGRLDARPLISTTQRPPDTYSPREHSNGTRGDPERLVRVRFVSPVPVPVPSRARFHDHLMQTCPYD
ncbi:hypothetical protein C8Q79DRAFT_157327 [Trametes meyenii]|nr:hypothetical protein C8Q79DRAFT_157327 [Trametes meyenii]